LELNAKGLGMTSLTLPAFYISHGGGPWPWMEGQMKDAHEQLAFSLRQIPQLVGATPKAVLMISAHWEEPDFALMTHAHPPMLYDYHGFPEHTYRVEYPAPGAPLLAEEVRGLLQGAGFKVRLDSARGFDHGAFVPMAVAYPEANVPVLQLSLKQGLDPKEHIAAGRALTPLRDEGVLILGSGFSYHNLRAMGPEAKGPSAAFDAWLNRTLLSDDHDQRTAALAAWDAAPAARQAHPQEEHLLPLMVVVGAAENDRATRIYHQDDFYGSTCVSSFMLGNS
jgi:aromatic ring-opening dioxygenase catalytic subunit (LigB family)